MSNPGLVTWQRGKGKLNFNLSFLKRLAKCKVPEYDPQHQLLPPGESRGTSVLLYIVWGCMRNLCVRLNNAKYIVATFFLAIALTTNVSLQASRHSRNACRRSNAWQRWHPRSHMDPRMIHGFHWFSFSFWDRDNQYVYLYIVFLSPPAWQLNIPDELAFLQFCSVDDKMNTE